MTTQIIQFRPRSERTPPHSAPLAGSSSRRGDPDWSSMPDKRLISVANHMANRSVPLPVDLSTELLTRGFSIPTN